MSDITEMRGTTKVNVDGRIVLPAYLRKPMGIKPGDDVELIYKDGKLHIVPVSQQLDDDDDPNQASLPL